MELLFSLSLKIPYYPFTDMPLFGKKRISNTRVGNLYNQTIWAKVSWEQKYVEASKATGGGDLQLPGIGISGRFQRCTKAAWKIEVTGLSPILPGGSQKFVVDSKDSPLVFITIIAENGDILCNALSRENDTNVVVQNNGQVVTATEDPLEPNKWSSRNVCTK